MTDQETLDWMFKLRSLVRDSGKRPRALLSPNTKLSYREERDVRTLLAAVWEISTGVPLGGLQKRIADIREIERERLGRSFWDAHHKLLCGGHALLVLPTYALDVARFAEARPDDLP